MKIKRFIGRDMRDALNQVKHELGGEAVIMSNKKVADGIEIVAAYDQPVAQNETPSASKVASQYAKTASTTMPQQQTAQRQAPANKKVPSLSEIIGDSGPDSLRELLEKQGSATNNAAKPKQHSVPHTTNSATSNATSPINTAQDKDAIADIKHELNELRNVLQFQVSGLLKQDKHRAHPLQGYLASRLEGMGISTGIAEDVVSYTPEESDERQAWLFLLKLMANRIQTTGNAILEQRGAVALVGPTGTGKTTTIAKLAARAAQRYGADQVALVTIDSYRIAAYEQLATYGKIIGCSVKKAQNAEELSDILFQLRNKRLVLIDTAGFGQRDSRLIKQLDTLNQHSCATIKKYVIMQANAQHKVMEHTINAYKSTELHGCILTKLDECYSLGEAISVAVEHNLAISYVTDGQRVPEDIKVADAKYLISAAAKLYKKYGLRHTGVEHSNTSALAV